MKEKVVKYLFIAASLMISLGSCDKAFLDVQPKGQFLSANYYADKDQAFAALVGVYDVLRKNSGGFENMITMMNAGSDDNFAGGGGATDGAGIQGFSNYTLNAVIMPGSFWSDHYQGIFRANTLLSKLTGVTMDAALKTRFVAETKALRASYYFNLVRMFKNVPLLLEPLTATNMYEAVQATPAAVYTQIEKDLTEAIADLPNTVPAATEAGRLTKGGAQAMLGKVYLVENKGAQAAAMLALVNGTPGGTSQYGYRLLSSYSDLWNTSNKFNTESIIEAAKERLRPILMTTLTLIFGLLPIAFSASSGSEWKSGLAVALVGGLASSMFLTLLVIPVVYVWFDKLRTRMSAFRWGKGTENA